MYEYLLLLFVIVWTSFYAFLYAILHKRFNAEWISRVVAITHALAIARSVEYTAFIDNTWPFDTMGFTNSHHQNLALCLTAGYFIFEISWCLYMRTEGVLMLIHHAISITAMLISLWAGRSASEVLLTTWGSELTNPFLQVRWFLRETKNYETVFAFLNDVVFFLLFFVVRVLVGGVVAFHLYHAQETVFVMKVCGFSFYALSLLWMVQIYKFAEKRIFGGYKSRLLANSQ